MYVCVCVCACLFSSSWPCLILGPPLRCNQYIVFQSCVVQRALRPAKECPFWHRPETLPALCTDTQVSSPFSPLAVYLSLHLTRSQFCFPRRHFFGPLFYERNRGIYNDKIMYPDYPHPELDEQKELDPMLTDRNWLHHIRFQNSIITLSELLCGLLLYTNNTSGSTSQTFNFKDITLSTRSYAIN